MKSKHLYLAWGVLVVFIVFVAEYQGWSLSRIDQVENVPKTVRDNPGAYRSTYVYYHRYIGGK